MRQGKTLELESCAESKKPSLTARMRCEPEHIVIVLLRGDSMNVAGKISDRES